MGALRCSPGSDSSSAFRLTIGAPIRVYAYNILKLKVNFWFNQIAELAGARRSPAARALGLRQIGFEADALALARVDSALSLRAAGLADSHRRRFAFPIAELHLAGRSREAELQPGG